MVSGDVAGERRHVAFGRDQLQFAEQHQERRGRRDERIGRAVSDAGERPEEIGLRHRVLRLDRFGRAAGRIEDRPRRQPSLGDMRARRRIERRRFAATPKEARARRLSHRLRPRAACPPEAGSRKTVLSSASDGSRSVIAPLSTADFRISSPWPHSPRHAQAQVERSSKYTRSRTCPPPSDPKEYPSVRAISACEDLA